PVENPAARGGGAAEGLCDIGVRELEADQQAAAAHVAQYTADQAAQLLTPALAELCGALRQLLAHRDVERGQAGCARQRMTAEGRDVRERWIVGQRLHDLRARDERAERQPTAERLGEY